MSSPKIEQTEFQCVGVVLAGGQALRMEGKNKALQEYKGRHLYAYVLDAMSAVLGSISINVNNNQAEFLENDLCIFSDAPSYLKCGPLSGIMTALNKYQATHSHILFSPCDTPLVPSDVFGVLVERARQNPESVFFMKTESGVQPLHAIIPVTLVNHLSDFLQQRQYKVMAFYRMIAAEEIHWDDESVFKNINYLEELS
ncbi:molybdenum cofactor guanylyltransferase [Marinomonas sp. 15G1-11]|uniref:Molybdenum cofactor guanylyltransferase n=1 Tax=Marinomonas phaeophyticola TaxID=3004091 RepID=A0ABT4JYE7_9GAMM|nr:molybdenum cofactor guanylyltransferase [Marinomonas sp. 15G1-11]MCZ2723413.1 molybdenum cofactor guanylyltransferase [Marinomonas sp. 15G1-11]